MSISSVTIFDNKAQTAPSAGLKTYEAIDIENTIIGNNEGVQCDLGPGATGSYNLFSDGSCPVSGINNQVGVDPDLELAQDNGCTVATPHGCTWTSEVRWTIPALDAGSKTLCPNDDQREMPRPIGIRCDIGAYERQP